VADRAHGAGDLKYVCCNADEGDSGTFADRMLMEGDPFTLIEGMAIAAHAVGRHPGLRLPPLRVPARHRALRGAIERARAAGWLGERHPRQRPRFDIEVRVGAGAYICGEETSMLESLEGKRGMVRPSRRCPRSRGCSASRPWSTTCSPSPRCRWVLADGGAELRALGSALARHPAVPAGRQRRRGGSSRRFGVTLRELIEDFGGGTASGGRSRGAGRRPARRLPDAERFDLPLDYEALAAAFRPCSATAASWSSTTPSTWPPGPVRDGVLRDRELRQVHAVPHRLGARRRGDRPIMRRRRAANLALLEDLCDVMTDGLAVRDGRPHPDAGAQRAASTSPRTSARPREAAELMLLHLSGHREPRVKNPTSAPIIARPGEARRVTVTIDGQP
jgi:formate dehydrogenase iron-sulfur subunit